MDVTPEEIKRQAIRFKDYWEEYNSMLNRFLEIIPITEDVTIERKSDLTLYDEFSEGKPVSL